MKVVKWFFVIIGWAIGISFLVVACSGDSEKTPSDPCDNDILARIAAETEVRKLLREPGSAKFSNVTATRKDLTCNYTVTGAVAGKNGFGGMSQQQFRMEVRLVEGKGRWMILDAEVQ